MINSKSFVPADNAKAYQLFTTSKRCSWATIQSKSGNANGVVQIYGVVESSVGASSGPQPGDLMYELVAAGDAFVIFPGSRELVVDLSHIFIKVANNNGTDGVNVAYTK